MTATCTAAGTPLLTGLPASDMSLLSNLPQPCLVAWVLFAAAATGKAADCRLQPTETRTHQRHTSLRTAVGLVCHQHCRLPSFSGGHLPDPLASPAVLQVFPYVSGFISAYMTIPFSPLWSGILAALLLMMLRSCLLRLDKPLHRTLWVRLLGCAVLCWGAL